MGLSILTFIISIFAYIGDFFYSLWNGMSTYFVTEITFAFNTIFTQYATDLNGAGIYAPLLFIATIAAGALLSIVVLSAGKIVEDFE